MIILKYFSVSIILLQFNVSGSDKKGCSLNDVLIHEELFPNFACWKCYESLKTFGRLVKVNCKIPINDEQYSVPGFVVDSECVPFDHRTNSISTLVQRSLTNSTFIKWKSCCADAVTCCESMMRNYQVENFFDTCDNHWDGRNCFPDTFSKRIVNNLCPDDIAKHETSNCPHFYSKVCHQNGSWSVPDFTKCFESKRLQSNVIAHIIIISLSLAICLPALLIILMIRSLLTATSKSISFMLTIIVSRNIFILLSKLLIYIDPTILSRNLWFCKVSTVSTEFLDTSSYLFLLIVAVQLQSLIEREINKKLLLLGFILSSLTTTTWSLLMHFNLNRNCWQSESNHFEHLTSSLVRGIAILFTIVLLINVVRKVEGASRFLSKHLLAFTFLFLLPLIIHLIQRENFNVCGSEETFQYILIVCCALQGIWLVPLIMMDKDILKAVKSSQADDSNGSNVSLATSEVEEKQLWLDLVRQASTSSFTHENFYSIDPSPPVLRNFPSRRQRTQSENIPQTHQTKVNFEQRRNIRDVMRRAKTNFPEQQTPPLPKNIPNQIFDDVQLFDLYYKNLNSLCLAENSTENIKSNPEREMKEGYAIRRMKKLLT